MSIPMALLGQSLITCRNTMQMIYNAVVIYDIRISSFLIQVVSGFDTARKDPIINCGFSTERAAHGCFRFLKASFTHFLIELFSNLLIKLFRSQTLHPAEDGFRFAHSVRKDLTGFATAAFID
jgi:hypothetical protein